MDNIFVRPQKEGYMRKGFTYTVAPDLVRADPGRRGEEYADMAIRKGLAASDAKDPVQSLASSLAKEVREGRQKQIRREKDGSAIRYYPALSLEVSAEGEKQILPARREEAVSLRLEPDTARNVDMLVEIGTHRTRSDALAWLVAEGLSKNQQKIREVQKAVKQIREIKRSLKR